LALLLAAFLTGCAVPVQAPVELKPNVMESIKAKGGRVGVLMTELPKPNTSFPGADCLLCIGVANLNHKDLNPVVQAFSTQELLALPKDLVAMLKRQGLDAVLISEPVNWDALPDFKAADPTNKSRKDLGALRDKHKLDRILVVQVTALGVWRSYAAYVPTDVPRAVLNGQAALVDLSTHSLDWYLPLTLARAAEGPWSEPPKYPGLTNAYFQVLELGMDMVKKPFVQPVGR
jgi:hypothetical protein